MKLPGVTVDKPNVYDFETPYEKIAEDLRVRCCVSATCRGGGVGGGGCNPPSPTWCCIEV